MHESVPNMGGRTVRVLWLEGGGDDGYHVKYMAVFLTALTVFSINSAGWIDLIALGFSPRRTMDSGSEDKE